MPKQNFIPFDYKAWLADPRLSLCSPATRGIWLDALCAMWDMGAIGMWEGTHEVLAIVCRCTPAQAREAVAQLAASNAAEVKIDGERVLLINRRMRRQWEKRHVPRQAPPPFDDGFERFWHLYPRKVSKVTAAEAWQKLAPPPELVVKIIEAVQKQSTWEQWKKNRGKFIPHPTTWLNQRRWEDDDGTQFTTGPISPEERARRVREEREKREKERQQLAAEQGKVQELTKELGRLFDSGV